MNKYIKVDHLSKTIQGHAVLNDINLELMKGKIYGFRGKNGSGKTMLFRAISGLIRPSKGIITVNGKVIGKDISFPENLGLLIENPGFNPEYTGLKNLELLSFIQRKINKEQVKEAIMKVGLDPKDKRKYKKYSLGMKQRLGIAQAIMENPDLIILDEPTNALDEEGVTIINQIILDLKKSGKTILIASHDRESLDKVSDEIYQIDGGKIIGHEVISHVAV
ncbi:ATP-binding cassette domain-containing protein [Heyndrickxia sporothermodurans]|uniref:ATP-binding cassette domain-containing protein n=1 Tax=Heyndrickxia sporothermodurans TaxID=46224 RepID=UPI00192B87AC|nr:ATP-binding cassette domain-containing protein [Heyndrickxia sporothermodurans]MBL5889179.1 ATP-binding cassette domain-containing protein [Heyndrickxia sporothermodurans]MBL5896396.1 ATP-binding cassette domain-containing protein [Heyndrickxia sporothermodurans]